MDEVYAVKLKLYEMISALMGEENPTTTQLDMLNQALNFENMLNELDGLFGYYACYKPEENDE